MSLLPGQAPTKRLKLDEAPKGYEAGRGAKIPMQTRADLGLTPSAAPKRGTDAMFGNAPPGYVPGRGRGATGFIGGVSRDEVDRDDDKADLGDNNYDEFNGYGGSLFANMEYDEEDKEADLVYDKVDVKMDDRRKKQREKKMREQIKQLRAERPTIQQQFADLKRELGTVSNEEWEGIPEAQEHLKVKQRKPSSFTPTPDALLAQARLQQQHGRSLGGMSTPMPGTGTPMGIMSQMRTPMGLRTPHGMRTPMGLRTPMGYNTPMGMSTPMTPMGMHTPLTPMGAHTPMGMHTPMGGMHTPMGMRTPHTPMGMRTPHTPMGMRTPHTPMGMRTPHTPMGGMRGSINDLGEARGTVLAVKLDKIMDSVTGQTVMDPKGYLTDLNALQVQSDADISDIKKARTLLKSVITSNPKHGPGWIAAARLEEVAGKVQSARQLIAQGCKHCPANEDIWLEAARLEKPANAKAVLAKAVKSLPHSVRLWIDAAAREADPQSKGRVLRKALEFIPNSVRLWKEAVSLEDEAEARVMLSRAVECVPHSVEMWLALAKLSSYKDAQRVLNEARKHIPTSPVIWVTAAKLEETQGNDKMVELILTRAIDSLSANGVTADRDMWLKQAEEAEKTGFVKTCQAIVKVTIKVGVDDDPKGMKQNWIQDAEAAINRNAIDSARAIYNNAVLHLKTKKGLWLRLAELETKYGSADSLDQVLQRAVTFCPHAEILWLMAAKQKWLRGDVASARRILAEAFSHSKESEAIHLAAVKLESENNEIQRSRLLLQRARSQCNTPKVWMQSVQLEREQGLYQQALHLCESGLEEHPAFAKLWMIGGQILMEKSPPELAEAAKFFERGIVKCPRSSGLWLCAVDCEVKQMRFTKARSLLEKARLRNPSIDLLWLRGVEVELLDGNEKLAQHLMSKGLQDCPSSGILWAKAIELEPKAAQNAKSVDALKKCENDAHVIVAVAKLFWRDGKNAKARKWFNRAVTLNPRLGDAWGAYLGFELDVGTSHEQREVIRKCVDAEPNNGILWNSIVKRVPNWRLKWAQKLKKFVEEMFPSEMGKKDLHRDIEMLLNGEDPYLQPEIEEDEDDDMKGEDGKEIKTKEETKQFDPSPTFKGARPGFCFKLGPRGLGYYRDMKQEMPSNKKEQKDEPVVKDEKDDKDAA